MNPGPRCRGYAGALLIILLLGVGLMLLLTFGGGGLKGTAQTAQQAKNSAETTVNEVVVAQLVQAIAAQELASGRQPTGMDDLPAADSGAFNDPWGNRLSFVIEGDRRSRDVVITSTGPDGEPGTEDDIEIRRRLPV